MTIHVGTTVTLTFTFRDLDNALANVDSITVTVKDPAGTTTNPSATNVSTGIYRAQFDVTANGIWRYRVVGVSGTTDTTDEGTVCVEDSSFD